MEEEAKEIQGELVEAVPDDSLAEKEDPAIAVLKRRDSLDAQEAATANEVRECLLEVAANSRQAHQRAMECHDIFVDMVANGEDPDAVVKARDDMLKSLDTAQRCNDSMLKAVKLMLDSRKKEEGVGGVVQKGQIQNNFIFQGDHRKVNDALRRRNDEDNK